MAKPTQEKKSLAIVKQDGNFLEYPTYVLNSRTTVKEIVIERDNGMFRIATHNPKLPDRLDKTLLYYILEKIWKTGFKSREVKTTRYRIAKDILGGTIGKNDYKRIMEGLKRWKNISVEFEGIFYEGDNYTTRYFGFVEDVIMDQKTKGLTVRLNEQYLEWLQATKYYRLIDWKKFKSFSRDVSAKLYELFQVHSFPWKIEATNLAEKLTLSKKYPSQIIEKVIPAIHEINEKTNLNIKFSHYKNEEEKTIFVFDSAIKKIQVKRKRQLKLPFVSLAGNEIPKGKILDEKTNALIIRGITEVTARELVEKYPDRISKHVDILDHLIEKKDPKVSKNPAGFLCKSIEKDFASPKGYISKEQRLKLEEQKQKQRAEEIKYTQRIIEQENKKDAHLESEWAWNAKVDKFIATLPLYEQEMLKRQAKQSLREKHGGFMSNPQGFALNMEIRKITIEKYCLTPEKQEIV